MDLVCLDDRATDPFWSALAALGPCPAPAWRWQELLGADPAHSRFLRRTAQLADSVPCPHPCGCGQLHRVEEAWPGQFCAIPEAEDCESSPVSRDALAIYALHSRRLAVTVARALSLDADISEVGDCACSVRLGFVAETRTPLFLSFPTCSTEAVAVIHDLAAAVRGAFTVIVPTSTLLTHGVRTALAAHGATAAALDHVMPLSASDVWLFAELQLPSAPASPPLPAPAVPAAPPPTVGISARRHGNTWPHARPADPTWRDVKLTLHSQEVAVTFGPSQAKFDFRQIDGFTDQRGGKRPNRLWALLRAFALRDGVLPLPSKDDDAVRVRTLRELDTVLQRFFDLRSSAFEKLIEEDRVRCLFSVRAPD